MVFSAGRLTQAAGARQFVPPFLRSKGGDMMITMPQTRPNGIFNKLLQLVWPPSLSKDPNVPM